MAETKDKVITAESLSAVHTYNENTYLTKSNPTGTGTLTITGGGNFSGTVELDSLKIRNNIITSTGSYKPYYEAEDTVSGKWKGGGYVTTAKKEVVFTVPLSKPVIRCSAFDIDAKLIIRQNGTYTHGSSSSVKVVPESYEVEWGFGDSIILTCIMSDTTNAANNEACAVSADLTITFH